MDLFVDGFRMRLKTEAHSPSDIIRAVESNFKAHCNITWCRLQKTNVLGWDVHACTNYTNVCVLPLESFVVEKMLP